MKPRISLYRSVWDCRLPNYYVTRVIGYGFNPKDAYDEWLKKARATGEVL